MEVRNKILPSLKEIREKQSEEETFQEIETFMKNKDLLQYSVQLNCIKSQIENESALAIGVKMGMIDKPKMNNTLYYFYKFNALLSEYMIEKQITEGKSKPDTKERIDKLVIPMAELYIKHLREFFQT